MPSPFEAEIHSLLRDLGDKKLVADDLLRRWNLNLLNEQEQEDCAQFLLAAGFQSQFFAHLQIMIERKARLPWACVGEAVALSGLKSDDEARAMLEGARDQSSELELAHSRRLDAVHRTFSELHARALSERALRFEERKKELRDQLQYLRSQRLVEQEAKLLEQIQLIFPNEREFAVEKEALQLRWAREIIARSAQPATTPTIDLEWRLDKLTPEQRSIKGLIVERAKELVRSDTRTAYDLALGLHFMDLNTEAVEILDLAGFGQGQYPAGDWLKLELMLQARQYLTALDESSRLEIIYAGDPEAAFAVTYARARALRGLGQDVLAVDLLRSLVRIRPHYKSAHSLLLDWSGDEE